MVGTKQASSARNPVYRRIPRVFKFTAIAFGTLIFSEARCDLIANYTFDDPYGSSIALDATGHYNGTINGATAGEPGMNGTGGSYWFNGIDSVVNTLPAAAVPKTGTFSVWIKPEVGGHFNDANGQLFGTVSDIDSGRHGLVMNYYSEDNPGYSSRQSPTAIYYHDQGRVIGARDSAPIGQWSHLVYTYDSSINQAKIYINGQLSGQGSFTTPLTTHEHALMFGRAINTQPEYGFTGWMDEVRVYDQVLNDSQVEVAYLAQKTPAGQPRPSRIEPIADVGSGRKLVLVTHGWRTTEEDFQDFENLANAIRNQISS